MWMEGENSSRCLDCEGGGEDPEMGPHPHACLLPAPRTPPACVLPALAAASGSCQARLPCSQF